MGRPNPSRGRQILSRDNCFKGILPLTIGLHNSIVLKIWIQGIWRIVRRMIILETIIISLFFGGIGILLGSATIGIVGLAKIETSNLILQMLVGGSLIRPIISAGSISISLIGMILAGVLASLYPASIALRIEPRQAMASH